MKTIKKVYRCSVHAVNAYWWNRCIALPVTLQVMYFSRTDESLESHILAYVA